MYPIHHIILHVHVYGATQDQFEREQDEEKNVGSLPLCLVSSTVTDIKLDFQ